MGAATGTVKPTQLLKGPPPAGFRWADTEPTEVSEGKSSEEEANEQEANGKMEAKEASTPVDTPKAEKKTKPKRKPTAKEASTPVDTPKAEKKTKPKRKPTDTGLFAPLVVGAKNVMGIKELNKLRADVIKKHTKVISAFVDTSESGFGQIVLKRMFEAADKDDSGSLDREEVKEALFALGFTFVKDKDVDKIMKKADMDDNEVIDFEEFVKETPSVLRSNLVQLAKSNGHDLGFLA